MPTKRNIELDDIAAASLESRAAARGMTVSELVREFLDRDIEPLAVDREDIAELDRRWTAIEVGTETIPHEQVVGWLRSWGTPSFRPWHKR